MNGDISLAMIEIRRRLSALEGEAAALKEKLGLLENADAIVAELVPTGVNEKVGAAISYRGKGMTESVLLALANHYGAFNRQLPTLGELREHLADNGFEPPEHFSPALSATLARLAEQNQVIIETNRAGARIFRFRAPVTNGKE